jgi:hypothetical protein
MWSRNMDMAKDYWQPSSGFSKYNQENQTRQNNKQVHFERKIKRKTAKSKPKIMMWTWGKKNKEGN